MAEIDEAAVLERAKALAEKDGYVWEQHPHEKRAITMFILTGEQRDQYLFKARSELRKERANA